MKKNSKEGDNLQMRQTEGKLYKKGHQRECEWSNWNEMGGGKKKERETMRGSAICTENLRCVFVTGGPLKGG